jgi:hypothetical protein
VCWKLQKRIAELEHRINVLESADHVTGTAKTLLLRDNSVRAAVAQIAKEQIDLVNKVAGAQ